MEKEENCTEQSEFLRDISVQVTVNGLASCRKTILVSHKEIEPRPLAFKERMMSLDFL